MGILLPTVVFWQMFRSREDFVVAMAIPARATVNHNATTSGTATEMSDTTYRIWCFAGGCPFYITVSSNTLISELRKMIKECTCLLRGVDASSLTLWKPMGVFPVDPSDTIVERIENLGPDFSQFAEELDPADSVGEVFQNLDHSSPTSDCIPISVIVRHPARGLGESAYVVNSRESNTRTEFTMKLWGPDIWDRLCKDDLIYNNVKFAESSQLLKEFQGRLRRKRYVDNAIADENAVLWDCMASKICPASWNSYFETVSAAETNLPELDFVTSSEFLHYIHVIGGLGLRNKANYNEDKEPQVHALLLEYLEKLRTAPCNSWGFDTELRFHLVIEILADKFRYTPKCSFHMCINDFPHILLQVNSQSNEADQFRVLLQAACISRVGNWLRASTSGKPIVIMAIYIDKNFNAHQHLLHQPDVRSTEVEYVTNVFDLTAPQSALEFIFQLYNFFSEATADNRRLYNPEYRLLEAKNSVARKGYKRFSRLIEAMAQDGFGNPPELTRAGYTLAEPLPEEFTLVTPLKPTMREATSPSGVSVILKRVSDPHECEWLQYLSGIKAPSNHTIPLLEVIDLRYSERIIVLPWKTPLNEVLRFRDRPDDVVSFCLQFIEGVAFLHQHKVAHCDLKPENVVIDKSETPPQLFIIDFDLAYSVENEETMTQGWCGTPPWIAPELGTKDGPTRRYSPILADRWACGRMIEYFAMFFPTYEGERKTTLRAFARLLSNVNPRSRPRLDKLHAIQESTKRKSATSPQEPAPKRHAPCGESELEAQVTEA